MGISVKDIESSAWFPSGHGYVGCEIGHVRIAKSPDGVCSLALNQVGIAALFESVEAAASWADDPDGAEAMFKAINPPTGIRDNLVPKKVDE